MDDRDVIMFISGIIVVWVLWEYAKMKVRIKQQIKQQDKEESNANRN